MKLRYRSLADIQIAAFVDAAVARAIGDRLASLFVPGTFRCERDPFSRGILASAVSRETGEVVIRWSPLPDVEVRT